MAENKTPLADEILADAKSQAERKVSGAHKTAEKMIETAQAQAKVATDDIIKAMEKKLAHDASLITAKLPHHRQVKTLQIMNEAIEQLLSEAIVSIEKLPPEKRLQVIEHLATEAIEIIGGESVIIEIPQQDYHQFNENVRKDILAKYPKLAVQVREMAPSSGGVIVRSTDGTKVVDNTFAARMRHMRQDLRDQLSSVIFGVKQ